MKKIFALALAAVSTVSMFATINSQVTLYLDTDSKEVEARVACGDTYSPFNAGASAYYAPQYGNPSNIGMYVQYQGGDFMELNAPELINVPLVVVTSREASALQNYELFAEVGANHTTPLYLTDLRPDGGGSPVTIELNNLTDYTFTLKNEPAFVEGTNSVIADRFVINYVAPVTTVTTNAYGYASFSYTEDLKLATAGAKLYTGAISGEALNMTEVDYVKAGQGVIVAGAANTTYNLIAGTGSSVSGTNALIASANWTVSTENAYFLVGNEFKKYIGTDAVPAGKAYLIYTAGGANPAPHRIVMRFNGTEETQGIEDVQGDKVQNIKFVENGQVFIRRGNEVYNLQGQIVK